MYVLAISLSEQIHGSDYNKSELYQSIKNKVHFIKGSVTSYTDWKKSLKNQDAVCSSCCRNWYRTTNV
ncbi:hypothetical protein MASR2M78_15590 [Treponema sp.]